MRKKLLKTHIIILCAIVILAMAISGSVLAASTTKLLSTNFTVVNLGPATAIVDVYYWLQNGSAWPNVLPENKHFELDPDGGQKQIRQYTDTMDQGAGSVVIESGQPLGAIAQIRAIGAPNATSGAYKGFTQDDGHETFYIPLVAHEGNSASGIVNSQIIIQNINDSPVDVTVDLVPLPGFSETVHVQFNDIPAGASKNYDVQEEVGLPPTGWFGSAVVQSLEAGKEIAVVSNIFFGADGLQTLNAFPGDSPTDNWVVPIFTSRLANGLSTVVTIQNLSGEQLAAGSVTLVCKQDGTGNPLPTPKSNATAIAPNAGYNFNPVTDGTFPSDWFGSCEISAPSGKNIIAFVQMRYVGREPVVNTAAYEALPANGTSTQFYIPLIAKRLANSFATVVNIGNLSNFANTVKLTYIPSPIECPVALCDKSLNVTVGPEDSIPIPEFDIVPKGQDQRNHRLADDEPLLPDGWIGALKVVSLDNLPISGIVQLTFTSPLPGDTSMAHGVFPK